MYYYDTATEECEQFIYDGVATSKNLNRFETQQECERTCKEKTKSDLPSETEESLRSSSPHPDGFL